MNTAGSTAFLRGNEATVNLKTYCVLWKYLDWHKIEDQVNKLQSRIAKAVIKQQHRLRKRLSYLLRKSFFARLLAVRKVTQNKGKNTPGIDGITWKSSKAKMEAVSLLKKHRYRMKPLKRTYIEKKDKSKKRPLSIPCMFDRAVQALYAMTLEPIAETTGDLHSFGFRKHRSAKDACSYAKLCLQQRTSAEWVLEADIQGCFDNIDHDWLMAQIPMEKAILKEFLKARFKDGDQLYDTVSGVPQGGIISPILANLTLDGLEEHIQNVFWRSKTGAVNRQHNKHKVHMIRYADDLIITADSKETAHELKTLISQFLSTRGLNLSEKKTKITNIKDGFDFLGWNFRKYNNNLQVHPSKDSVKNIKARIGSIISDHLAASQDELIGELNPVLRGWSNYHNAVSSWREFRAVDRYVFYSLWRWAKRRHPMKQMKWVKDRYWTSTKSRDWIFISGKYKLFCISSVRYKRHSLIKVNMNCFLKEDMGYFDSRKKK